MMEIYQFVSEFVKGMADTWVWLNTPISAFGLNVAPLYMLCGASLIALVVFAIVK